MRSSRAGLVMSRTAVQALQAARRHGMKQPAGWVNQSLATGAGSSGDWVGLRAQAAYVTGDQVRQVRAQLPSSIRKIASDQIQKARDLYSRVSGSDWHNLLTDHVHWAPFKKLVEDAQESLDLGDKEPTEKDKKERYIAAWLAAQVAVERIGHEANLAESDWAVYIDPVKDLVAEVVTPVKQAADGVFTALGSAVKALGVGLAIYSGITVLGSLRGK